MLMLSEIDPNFVKDLNIDSYKNIDELLEKVDFEGKDVCILPYGGSVDVYKRQYNRCFL